MRPILTSGPRLDGQGNCIFTLERVEVFDGTVLDQEPWMFGSLTNTGLYST